MMDRRPLRTIVRKRLQWMFREVLDEHASEREHAQRQRHHELAQALDGLQALLEAQQTEVEAVTAEVAPLRGEVAATHAELGAVRSELTGFEVRARRDLHYAAEVAAAAESAAFALEKLPLVPTFPHPDETLRHSAGLVAVPGCALEFGVGGGHTLRLMVEALPDRRVVGFDVFTGLPEVWRTGFPAGAFAQEALPEVPGAELVVGLFEDALPGFLAENHEPVAFLHLDADLYSATKTVLDLAGSRLVSGSVVLFDEYFNYPGWQDGEHRAWMEYVDKTGLTVHYAGYTYDHEQVIVVVDEHPASAVATTSIRPQ